jgi:octaprenyl-diphosphate synthase
VIAGPKADAAACRSYGLNLGIAFQLIDDALDYGGVAAKLGKNTGDDFREGKITLPVVLSSAAATRSSAPSGSARCRTARSATATWKRHGRSCAGTRRSTTPSPAPSTMPGWPRMLGLFPASPMKQALNAAVDFCVARAH